MPPEAPVSMPPQDLRFRSAAADRRHRSTAAVLFARFILVA